MRSVGYRTSLWAAVLALTATAAPAWGHSSSPQAPAGDSQMSFRHGARPDRGMVWIPPGRYKPLYKRPRRDPLATDSTPPAPRVEVAGFWLKSHPVTNAEYLEFVRDHPEWRRSRARRLFVDEGYLRHWRSDLDYGNPVLARSPVVNVSWFAARAYCASHSRQLPTVDQWEYVAAASAHKADATDDSLFQERLRVWYSEPTPDPLPRVGSTYRNLYGIWDMHGLVWEWTDDFSSAMVNGESRAGASLDQSLFCGSGATNATDFRNYAAFMRFAFRSSLSARYCVPNLGFREASRAAQGAPKSPGEPR